LYHAEQPVSRQSFEPDTHLLHHARNPPFTRSLEAVQTRQPCDRIRPSKRSSSPGKSTWKL